MPCAGPSASRAPRRSAATAWKTSSSTAPAWRRPLGLAEALLTFSNDGDVNLPWSEVSVGRGLNRDGESEYLLNKQVCRLKDVPRPLPGHRRQPEGLRADGAGAPGPILTARPLDRRLFVEEAAGITRCKSSARKPSGSWRPRTRTCFASATSWTRSAAARLLERQARKAKRTRPSRPSAGRSSSPCSPSSTPESDRGRSAAGRPGGRGHGPGRGAPSRAAALGAEQELSGPRCWPPNTGRPTSPGAGGGPSWSWRRGGHAGVGELRRAEHELAEELGRLAEGSGGAHRAAGGSGRRASGQAGAARHAAGGVRGAARPGGGQARAARAGPGAPARTRGRPPSGSVASRSALAGRRTELGQILGAARSGAGSWGGGSSAWTRPRPGGGRVPPARHGPRRGRGWLDATTARAVTPERWRTSAPAPRPPPRRAGRPSRPPRKRGARSPGVARA